MSIKISDKLSQGFVPKPTKAFEIVNHFLGWGEPKGGVWFVGLEEAAGWSGKTQEDIFNHYKGVEYSKPDYGVKDWGQFGQKGKQIRDTTCKIVQPLSQTGKKLNWSEYRDKHLWAKGSLLFQANLFPIGKPTFSSWPSDYTNLFGFSAKERDIYRQYITRTRHERIKALWLSEKPQAVICFGKEGWPYCKKIFQLKSKPNQLVPGKVYSYSKERVILTPFFAYGHVNNEDAKKISHKLAKWGVSIP